MRKIIVLLVLILFITSCEQYIPRNKLNGVILTDANGKEILLEWQSGKGENWRFKEKALVINGNDTIEKWVYMDDE